MLLEKSAELRSRVIYWYLPLLIFPAIFFIPVFTSNLGEVFLVPNVSGLTDTLGLVRVAQMSTTLSSPLGIENWTNFPIGELNWSLSGLTQSIQLVILWILGKSFYAFAAANLFLLMGWLFTSVSVMYLTKNLGVPYYFALTAGITTQFLQSMQLANATVPSMLFVGFPILIVAFLNNFVISNSIKYFYFAITCLMASAFFDGYVYYFSLIAFWALVVLRPKQYLLKIKRNLWINITLVFMASSIPILAKIANAIGADTSGTNRKLLSPSPGLMNVNGFTITDFFVPHPESLWVTSGLAQWVTSDAPRSAASLVGVGIIVVVIAAVYKSIAQKNFKLVSVIVVTFIFYLYSLHGYWLISGILIPNPAALTLWFFPGALYIDRAAFVVQPLLVSIAFVGLWLLVEKLKNSKVQIIFATALLVVTFVELQPLATRVIPGEYSDYSQIRKVIEGKPFLFLPETFKGRSWIQQVFIEAPMKNSLQQPGFAELVLEEKFPQAPQRIACNLLSEGIRYVVLEERYLGKDPQVRNKLVEPYFSTVATSKVSAYESGRTDMVVLKVEADCVSG